MSDQPAASRRGLGKPDIVQIEAGVAAVEWGRVRFADLPQFHCAARARVAAALSKQTVESGANITFSRGPSGDGIELAPGVMIRGSFTPADAVTVERIPAGSAAHLKLEAGYENLPQAWAELTAWVESQKLQPAGQCWEVYGDPAVPVTDLYIRLK